MKKLIIILIACCTMTGLYAQNTPLGDAPAPIPASKDSLSISLLSRNVFRGVGYSKSPSIAPMAAYMPCKFFEIGTYGFITTNGNTAGYGNELNIYTTFKYKQLSLTFDDFYYLYDESYKEYFEWNSEKTFHFVEARLRYDSDFKLHLMGAYTIYSNKADTTNAAYFEASYDLTSKFSVCAGYLTSASSLMFMDKGGFNNVGVTYTKSFDFKYPAIVRVSLIVNPNAKHVSPVEDVVPGPHLVASITF